MRGGERLGAVGRWVESHPTHVRLFGGAMKYLSTLGPAAKLRLYHEVTVARDDEQLFEYVDCHPQPGMLNALRTVEAAGTYSAIWGGVRIATCCPSSVHTR